MNALYNSNSVIGLKIAYFRAKYRVNFITSTRSTIMSSICVTVPTEDQTVSINNLFSLLSARSDLSFIEGFKQDIMLELLRIKFIPGSDLAKRLVATSGKSLAEAGQSGVYSIGMTLNNKELFDTQKWTKNVLGELLMKVRQELM